MQFHTQKFVQKIKNINSPVITGARKTVIEFSAIQPRTIINSPIIKDFFIYSFGTILLKSSSVILMPLILKCLATDEFGLFSLMQNFITIVAILIGFGLRQVVSIEFFHVDRSGQKKLINDIIALYLAFATPLLIVTALNNYSLNQYIFFGKAQTPMLVIALLTCFVTFFNELFFQIMRYTARALTLTKIQLSAAILTISLKFYFLYSLGWHVTGMLFANLLGLLVIFACALAQYLKKIKKFKITILGQKQKALHYLACGLPFIPSVLFSWILSSADRWVLAGYGTLHDVGIYSFAAMFAQVYQLCVLIPLISAYFPHIIKKFVQEKNNEKIIEEQNRRIMYTSMIGMTLLVSIIFLISRPLLSHYLPERYKTAIPYILPLLFGQILLMGTQFATCYLQYRKKIVLMLLLTSIPATINLILNIILVRQFGVAGCIAATILAYIAYFLLTLISSSHLQQKQAFAQKQAKPSSPCLQNQADLDL